MYREYHGFLHFLTSSSQSKPANNTGIYSVLTRPTSKKTRCFETSFHKISAPPFKNDHFLLYFCHCSSGLKKPPPELKLTCVSASGRHALLHLRCGRIYFSNLDPEMQLHGKAEANQFSGVFLLLIS